MEYTYDDIKWLVSREEKLKEQCKRASRKWCEKNKENGTFVEKKKEYRNTYNKKKLEKPGESFTV